MAIFMIIGMVVIYELLCQRSVWRAFRPWIDRVEDFVGYALIIISRDVVEKIMEYSKDQSNIIFKL